MREMNKNKIKLRITREICKYNYKRYRHEFVNNKENKKREVNDSTAFPHRNYTVKGTHKKKTRVKHTAGLF